jgi:hypothetical protein
MVAVGRSFELTCEEFTHIPQLAGEALPQLHGFLEQQGITPSGREVFEYRPLENVGGSERPQGGWFRLTIAVPVTGPVTPPAPIEAVHLGDFRYVEVVKNSFREEWPLVREVAEGAGYTRTGIEREVYHAWRGEGHPDTRVSLQVGVE